MRRSLILAQALLSFLALCACADSQPETASAPPASTESAPERAATGPLVLFLGDSLSAGLHLREEQAFPAVLQESSIAAGHSFRLINAGLSGDTTAGGLGRLAWNLKRAPDLVVLELGANDGLRGIKLESIRSNLSQMVEAIQASGAEVLLLGMRMPPNYGPAYTSGFEDIYKDVAEEHGIAWVPFFLEGVAAQPGLNLPDGIHPNAAGHKLIAKNLESYLWELLPKQ